jgi:hypothetical protein
LDNWQKPGRQHEVERADDIKKTMYNSPFRMLLSPADKDRYQREHGIVSSEEHIDDGGGYPVNDDPEDGAINPSDDEPTVRSAPTTASLSNPDDFNDMFGITAMRSIARQHAASALDTVKGKVCVLTGEPPKPWKKADIAAFLTKECHAAAVEPNFTKRTQVVVFAAHESTAKLQKARAAGLALMEYGRIANLMGAKKAASRTAADKKDDEPKEAVDTDAGMDGTNFQTPDPDYGEDMHDIATVFTHLANTNRVLPDDMESSDPKDLTLQDVIPNLNNEFDADNDLHFATKHNALAPANIPFPKSLTRGHVSENFPHNDNYPKGDPKTEKLIDDIANAMPYTHKIYNGVRGKGLNHDQAAAAAAFHGATLAVEGHDQSAHDLAKQVLAHPEVAGRFKNAYDDEAFLSNASRKAGRQSRANATDPVPVGNNVSLTIRQATWGQSFIFSVNGADPQGKDATHITLGPNDIDRVCKMKAGETHLFHDLTNGDLVWQVNRVGDKLQMAQAGAKQGGQVFHVSCPHLQQAVDAAEGKNTSDETGQPPAEKPMTQDMTPGAAADQGPTGAATAPVGTPPPSQMEAPNPAMPATPVDGPSGLKKQPVER